MPPRGHACAVPVCARQPLGSPDPRSARLRMHSPFLGVDGAVLGEVLVLAARPAQQDDGRRLGQRLALHQHEVVHHTAAGQRRGLLRGGRGELDVVLEAVPVLAPVPGHDCSGPTADGADEGRKAGPTPTPRWSPGRGASWRRPRRASMADCAALWGRTAIDRPCPPPRHARAGQGMPGPPVALWPWAPQQGCQHRTRGMHGKVGPGPGRGLRCRPSAGLGVLRHFTIYNILSFHKSDQLTLNT